MYQTYIAISMLKTISPSLPKRFRSSSFPPLVPCKISRKTSYLLGPNSLGRNSFAKFLGFISGFPNLSLISDGDVNLVIFLISCWSNFGFDFNLTLKILSKHLANYNHIHNILRLFDVLTNFPYTTSETMRNYYL